jgi:hypothetical protein
LTKRKRSQRLGEEEGAAFPASNLGRRARIFEEGEVIRLLRAAVEREGGQSAFARRRHVNRAVLNRVLNGKLPVHGPIAKALRLRKVFVAE